MLTDAAPAPVIAAVAGRSDCPRFFALFPKSPVVFETAANVELALPVVSFKDFSLFSVSMISLWRASYCSFPRSPDSSCAFACLSASFKLFSLLSVWLISCCKSFCFCASSSVFLGSSFKSLLTSFSVTFCTSDFFFYPLRPYLTQ